MHAKYQKELMTEAKIMVDALLDAYDSDETDADTPSPLNHKKNAIDSEDETNTDILEPSTDILEPSTDILEPSTDTILEPSTEIRSLIEDEQSTDIDSPTSTDDDQHGEVSRQVPFMKMTTEKNILL